MSRWGFAGSAAIYERRPLKENPVRHLKLFQDGSEVAAPASNLAVIFSTRKPRFSNRFTIAATSSCVEIMVIATSSGRS
jgi:hypothetical protein